MHNHILVSTDGSKLSEKAIRTACALASSIGAKVTGLFVVPPYVPPVYSEGMIHARAMSKSKYRASCRRAGREALAAGGGGLRVRVPRGMQARRARGARGGGSRVAGGARPVRLRDPGRGNSLGRHRAS